jgi:uncharacterized tellurite resistance protein B-like protein
MLDRLKEMMGLSAHHGVDVPDEHAEQRLAAACILVEASQIDGEVDQRESDRLKKTLADHFELSSPEADALIAQATTISEDSVDWNRFTRVLKATCDADERLAMMEMLWEVVLADNEVHAYEDSMLRRVAGLLQVDDHERALAKRRAQAKLDHA